MYFSVKNTLLMLSQYLNFAEDQEHLVEEHVIAAGVFFNINAAVGLREDADQQHLSRM